MSTELDQVTMAVTAINKVEAGLAALREQYAGVVFGVDTTEGMEAAKEARRAVREPRLDVERIRKAAKAPLLALGKRLDSEAARITAELEKIEDPIHLQIKHEEDRKEAEKQARIAAELARVAAIQERIEELRGCQTLTPTSGSKLISEHISDLERIPVDDSFAEFRPRAEDAKVAGLARLTALLATALAFEAEQDRIRLERAELARLRAEQAERDRLAREEQARKDAEAAAERARLEAVAKAERDAEAARQAEANRIERERIAEEDKRLAAQRAADLAIARAHAQEIEKERAENARIAGERRAELDRQETIARHEREAEEARLAAERAKFEAEREAARPKPKKGKPDVVRARIIEVVAAGFGVSSAEAVRLLSLHDWNAEAA